MLFRVHSGVDRGTEEGGRILAGCTVERETDQSKPIDPEVGDATGSDKNGRLNGGCLIR